MKNIFVFLGIILLSILLPIAWIALSRVPIETINQTFPSVTTAAGVTSANVTLSNTPDPDRAASITALYSSETLDSPLVATYNTTSRQLNVTGLNETASRDLTATYSITSALFLSLPYISQVFDALLYGMIIGLFVLVVMSIVNQFRGRGD